jgi:hypothetical protein
MHSLVRSDDRLSFIFDGEGTNFVMGGGDFSFKLRATAASPFYRAALQ